MFNFFVEFKFLVWKKIIKAIFFGIIGLQKHPFFEIDICLQKHPFFEIYICLQKHRIFYIKKKGYKNWFRLYTMDSLRLNLWYHMISFDRIFFLIFIFFAFTFFGTTKFFSILSQLGTFVRSILINNRANNILFTHITRIQSLKSHFA